VRDFWPTERKIRVSVDAAYSCEQVLQHLPEGIILDGRLHPNARLTDPVVVQSGKGRPREWGEDLPKPVEVAADTSVPWMRKTTEIYGENSEMNFKSHRAVWKQGKNDQALKVVFAAMFKGVMIKTGTCSAPSPRAARRRCCSPLSGAGPSRPVFVM